MSRRLDVINLGDPEQHPAPKMMSSCERSGCSGGPKPLLPPPPTFGEVRVNGVEISPEAIAQEIHHHPAPDAETAWNEAARALVVRELLLQEAHRTGVSVNQAIDDAGRTEIEEDALIRGLLEDEVSPAEPSDVECRRYYDANVNRFRSPDLFDAAHILIEPEGPSEEAWSIALERARRLIREIGDDASGFAAAARTHSGCASAQQDGSLGQIRRGELVPEVQTGLEALVDGTTSKERVKSRFGWHVLRLHRRVEGQTMPFEVVRERIADMLEARSWSLEAARYVADLASRNHVEGIRIQGSA